MTHRLIVTALAAAALLAGAPAAAQADRADCGAKLEHKYAVAYNKTADKLGKRAPGRNIRKLGIQGKRTKKVRDVKCKELRTSLATLERMIAPPSAPVSAQTPSASAAGAGGGSLSHIVQCESGGNYRAVDPSGTYYGAYQFDQRTWESVGGSGNPAAASPAEQDRRAQILYSQRGSSPWPVCGG